MPDRDGRGHPTMDNNRAGEAEMRWWDMYRAGSHRESSSRS